MVLLVLLMVTPTIAPVLMDSVGIFVKQTLTNVHHRLVMMASAKMVSINLNAFADRVTSETFAKLSWMNVLFSITVKMALRALMELTALRASAYPASPKLTAA